MTNTAAQTRTISREIEGKTFELGFGRLAVPDLGDRHPEGEMVQIAVRPEKVA